MDQTACSFKIRAHNSSKQLRCLVLKLLNQRPKRCSLSWTSQECTTTIRRRFKTSKSPKWWPRILLQRKIAKITPHVHRIKGVLQWLSRKMTIPKHHLQQQYRTKNNFTTTLRPCEIWTDRITFQTRQVPYPKHYKAVELAANLLKSVTTHQQVCIQTQPNFP